METSLNLGIEDQFEQSYEITSVSELLQLLEVKNGELGVKGKKYKLKLNDSSLSKAVSDNKIQFFHNISPVKPRNVTLNASINATNKASFPKKLNINSAKKIIFKKNEVTFTNESF